MRLVSTTVSMSRTRTSLPIRLWRMSARTKSVRASACEGSRTSTPTICSTEGSASSRMASSHPQKREMPVMRTRCRATAPCLQVGVCHFPRRGDGTRAASEGWGRRCGYGQMKGPQSEGVSLIEVLGESEASAGAARVSDVYAREHTRLSALGAMLTGDAAAGEDLAHDVFMDALRLSRNDPGYLREPAWPWLRLALVRRALRRRQRLAGELRRLPLLHSPSTVSEELGWSAGTMDCLAALAALPSRMRACAVLFYWQDMSTLDVARELGLSPRTVENQLARARARLAERLREEQ